MIDIKMVARHFSELRRTNGLSMVGLARRSKLARSFLYKFEEGTVPNPRILTIEALAEALGVSLAEFVYPGKPTGRSKRARSSPSLPKGLDEFIAGWTRTHRRKMPADVIRTLAGLSFSSQRPVRAQDWRSVYEAIRGVLNAQASRDRRRAARPRRRT